MQSIFSASKFDDFYRDQLLTAADARWERSKKRKLERRMRIETLATRRALFERKKAEDAARNPGFSRFGDCLVSVNSKTDEVLLKNLKQINSEIKRMELQNSQKRKLFLRTSGVLNHDPIILVERPPSPAVLRKAHTLLNNGPYDEELFGETKKPGFMQPLRSRTRTPSTLTTIDAFTVKARKKRNVWEDAMDDKTAPQFTGTVRPYARLTKKELTELQMGHEMHKPKFVVETGPSSDRETDSVMKALVPSKKAKPTEDIADTDSEGSVVDEITPFITQMATVRKTKGGAQKEKEKSVVELNDAVSKKSSTPTASTQSPVTLKEKPMPRYVRFSSPVVASFKTSTVRPLRTKITKIAY